MEITIHTGEMGDQNRIRIAWFDQENEPRETVIDVNILDQDKPRTLQISIDGRCLFERGDIRHWVAGEEILYRDQQPVATFSVEERIIRGLAAFTEAFKK